MSQNLISDLDILNFIKAWDGGADVVNNVPTQVQASENGNLNSSGDPMSAVAPVVTKHHPLFFSFVEQGVQALVKKIVIDLNYVTFSSCQGHPAYNAHGEWSELRPRGLSILPRHKAELQEIVTELQHICDQTNAEMTSEYVVVEVKKERLEVFNDGYIKHWQCIELTFTPLINDSKVYFDVLEEIYQAFLKNLSNSVTM
jgi:hypothetical protein